MSDGMGKHGKAGRSSAAHSALQMEHLNSLKNKAVTGPRADFMYNGHGVFRGLVTVDTVASLRAEATAIEEWSGIFNKGSTTKTRRKSKAPDLSPKVNRAIFEFLQTRAILATKCQKFFK
jgi:hypothetical protein